MRLYSWNVNGLRAVLKKNFDEFMADAAADILCLQETKLSDGQLDREFDEYQAYFNYADKKGYSGTAVLTKQKPLKVTLGIGMDRHDHEGRVVTLEFEEFYLVNVYVPNSQNELARLDYRLEWEEAFNAYIRSLDTVKPVIICGDLNVAHQEIDLKNPKTNHFNPGFTDQEREAFSRLLSDCDLVDTYRLLHPDTQTFSWWSYRYSARSKNIGWRIDYFLMSRRLSDRLTAADIHTDVLGSDHCPVSIIID